MRGLLPVDCLLLLVQDVLLSICTDALCCALLVGEWVAGNDGWAFDMQAFDGTRPSMAQVRLTHMAELHTFRRARQVAPGVRGSALACRLIFVLAAFAFFSMQLLLLCFAVGIAVAVKFGRLRVF